MSEEIVLDLQDEELNIVPASSGKRIGNLLIDIIICYLFIVIFGVLLYVFVDATETATNPFIFNVIGYVFYLMYYFTLEVSTGKTIGKMITKTKVVKEDGSEPDTKTILVRSLCRLIPFDAFSFLGKDRIGWHDSIAKSRVVNA